MGLKNLVLFHRTLRLLLKWCRTVLIVFFKQTSNYMMLEKASLHKFHHWQSYCVASVDSTGSTDLDQLLQQIWLDIDQEFRAVYYKLLAYNCRTRAFRTLILKIKKICVFHKDWGKAVKWIRYHFFTNVWRTNPCKEAASRFSAVFSAWKSMPQFMLFLLTHLKTVNCF